MPVLTIGPQEREAVRKVVEFATVPAHHFWPDKDVRRVPGIVPDCCVMLGDYRFVFSITHFRNVAVRHLTFSLNLRIPEVFPRVVVQELGELFGFTGQVDDWIVAPHRDGNCIVMAQPLPSLVAPPLPKD